MFIVQNYKYIPISFRSEIFVTLLKELVKHSNVRLTINISRLTALTAKLLPARDCFIVPFLVVAVGYRIS